MAFKDKTLSKVTVCRWSNKFKRGRVSMTDGERCGCPLTVVTQENVLRVKNLSEEIRSFYCCEQKANERQPPWATASSRNGCTLVGQNKRLAGQRSGIIIVRTQPMERAHGHFVNEKCRNAT
ncbi:hypothetical protein EVAR_6216_1 [Eumeta japonica]|uniref:Mos1 transposase HTH domain-containing protein n=1 Tax=Eumeta variegata TaxID=151549 RepID=A0A4C1YZ51_EUMVA|nr:hypothetical protein EVAR_6216_1 [Eumeta japonica]